MSVRIEVPGKPKLLNALSKSSHWAVSAEVKEWREAAHWAAKAARVGPQLPPVVIHVYHEKSKRWSDSLSATWAIKGATDGFVDAGLFPDDSPQYVAGHYCHAPQVTGRDALVFEFEPV